MQQKAKSRTSISTIASQLRHESSGSSKQRLHQRPIKSHIAGYSILQERDRLKIEEDGIDVTPRALSHPNYASLEVNINQ